MTEKEKKKLIRVEPWTSSSGIYTSKNILFAFVTRAKDAEDIVTRKQSTQFFSCRDHINDALRAHVHKRDDGVYKFGTNPPIDMDKMRMLVSKACDKSEFDTYRDRFFSAKRLLNFYEKMAGWEQSKITTVRLKKKKDVSAWLVTGPKQWVSYSHLMSMVTLIFRVVGNYGPIEFTDNDSVEQWFKDLIDESKASKDSSVYRHDVDIDSYLPASWEKFRMLVTKYDEIFTQSIDEAYPTDANVHSAGGVYHLCSFQNTHNPTLDKNMKTVWDDYCIQKQKGKVRKAQAKISKKCEDAHKIAKPTGL